MHTIRARITALTMAAIVTCILVLGGISFFILGAVIDQISVEKMTLTSSNAQQSLDSYLTDLKQSVELVSHIAVDSLDDVSLSDLGVSGSDGAPAVLTPEQQKRATELLANHRSHIQEEFGSVASHSSGVVAYYYCINPAVSETEHGFFVSRSGLSGYVEQAPIDARKLNPADPEHDGWYFTVMERGAACWVGPYPSRYMGDLPIVSYLVPVYKSGTIIGVMGMDILFDTLTSRLRDLAVYKTGFACLLQSDGRVLYHPEMAVGDLPQDDNRDLDMTMFEQDSSGTELIRYNADGEQRQLSFSTLTNGMKLVVTAPLSEVTASQRHLVQILALAAIAIFVGFAIYTHLLAGAVTKPLVRLTAAARRLAEGNYDVELDYEGDDEVGTLTHAFRQMSEQLGARMSDLSSQAYTDALTGIKNKAYFDEMSAELDEAIQRAREGRGEHPVFGIALFDCNHLKPINDLHGHARGDVYLRVASQTLCATYAHSPVFRIGGDEFAVLLRGHDYDHRDELAEFFDYKVRETNAIAADPWDRVDLARGFSKYRPGEDSDVEHVLRRADERMYEDKRQSRA